MNGRTDGQIDRSGYIPVFPSKVFPHYCLEGKAPQASQDEKFVAGTSMDIHPILNISSA